MIQALLTGNLNSLPPDLEFLLARTGLVHLFASAGLHLAAAMTLSRYLGQWAARFFCHPKAGPVCNFALSLALLFIMARQGAWSSPIVRAFTYSALLSLATLLEIRASRIWVFGLSLLFSATLGQSSWLSFSLSALGMAAILFVKPRNLLTLVIAPWAATLPLTLWYFQLFPLWAPLWNLTLGMLLGFTILPLVALLSLLQGLGLPSAWLEFILNGVLAKGMDFLRWGDAWIGGAYWVPPVLFLFVSAGLMGAWALSRKKPKSAAALGTLTVILALLTPRPTLRMLDVGQGDAIYFTLASGKRILEDQGPPAFRTGVAKSSRSLEQAGLGSLDDLVFSHMDRDHVGGAPSILERHPVREAAWFREVHVADPRAEPILAALERARVPVHLLKENPFPDFRCWLPPPVDSNDSSSFCRAEMTGGTSIWLTGDAAFPSEAWLLAQGPIPKATYLKVGHHGSKTSSSDAFVRATGAEIALVSVGKKNRYGHPTKEALRRLENAGMEVHRTDQEGALDYW